MKRLFLLLAWGTTMAGAAPAVLRTLPSALWAMQAALPPGSNTPDGQSAVPVPVPVGELSFAGQNAAGQAPPAGGGGGPIGADGRMPGLPPGIPLGPPGPGARSGSPQMPGAPNAPSPRVSPGAITQTPAPTKPIPCEVRLHLARIDLPPVGGEFSIPAVATPATCRPKLQFESTWLRVLDPVAFRLVADPNTTAVARDVVVAIGQASFFVRQEPPAQPGLAAAPGRLVFGVDRKGKTDTKSIAAWTEYGSGSITARAGNPWLSVKPLKRKKDRQAYEVTVQRDAKLGPGRHDSYIELAPEGSGPTLRIPVVVEVTGTI